MTDEFSDELLCEEFKKRLKEKDEELEKKQSDTEYKKPEWQTIECEGCGS
jgi:hypothetical protein